MEITTREYKRVTILRVTGRVDAGTAPDFDAQLKKQGEYVPDLAFAGYDYVMSYEHEDVTMSRRDGITKTIAYLKPLLIEKPYEGRHDVLFN